MIQKNKDVHNLKNSSDQLKETLKKGLDKADINIPEATQDKLVEYIELLHKWNQVHNLTSVKDPVEMINRHVLDSLVLLPFLPSPIEHSSEISQKSHSTFQILDVGTGAGLPGIPLALCRPDCHVVLLDSSQKKINFVKHVIISLLIPNATAVSARVEQYKAEALFDWVVSRAFASLSQFVVQARHLCKPEGKFVAMKSASIETTEIEDIPNGFSIEKIESVLVPNLDVERSLVFITMEV